MIALLLLLPVCLGVILFAANSRVLNMTAPVLCAAAYCAASGMLYLHPAPFTPYFAADSLNVLFISVLSVLFLGVSLYNIGFIRHRTEDRRSQTFYTIYLLLFVASMSGVIMSTHLALLWVFIEATTLSSAYLIYHNKTDSSLEATWKYLFICSIGISIAFVGITLLSMGLGGSSSLFFGDLYAGAGSINRFWLKIAFPFILVGFGTKIGFAPMHAWLPDAHSESPSQISALLSGTLLNAALLGVLRVCKLMDLAGLGWYVKILLLLTGFLCLFVTAVYIGNVKNYKRMLAYSSIENMGIIAIGVGVGGAGLFAALLHLIAHSLTKASFFLTAGNVLHLYRTREIDEVRGLLKNDRGTGWLWIFSFIAIIGLPPFPMFLSEFLIAKAMFQNGQAALAVLFFLLLTIIMAGMARNVLRMSFGDAPLHRDAYSYGAVSYIPQMAFMAMLLAIGVSIPGFIQRLIETATAYL